MKKFMMTGVAALVFAATLTNCSKSDLYDEGVVKQQKEATVIDRYNAAFEKAFGKVGPNVDWGFSSKKANTRAFTRAVGTYAQYKGNIQPTLDPPFPSDCDASKFTPDLTDIPSYQEYLISKGTQYWHPEEINDGGVVYIDAVQPIKISGGTEEAHAKLYIKAGTYDFTGVSFDLNTNTDLYLLEGATVTFDNTVTATAIFDIYIAPGAQLIANGENGLVANSGARVYNHGTITCSGFEVNSSSFLYNVGTVTAGSVNAESNNSRIVNDGTINSTAVVVNAGAVQNNDMWTVSGTTEINSNNSGWVNNGHWKTHDYAYLGGSWNVINNCFLEVENDFAMNISSEKGAFKIDAGGGVQTKYFDGGRSSTGAVSGPFVITMGSKAVFVVEETAILESGRGDENGFGIFGPTSGEYAVFQAKNIARDPYLASISSHGAVTYSGHLYVSAQTHFAQGMDSDGSGSYTPQPFIYEKGGFSIANNIYAAGFKSGKPSINIPQTPCSPGFRGGNPLYRVIAEDLSASEDGDFDFNDVVFDVVKYEGGKTTLRLQACGGTLPLKIGSTNGVGGIEVHSIYGDNTPDATTGLYKMWNTSPSLNSHAPEDFTINGEYITPEQLLNLRIEVEKDGTWMLLTATKGVAACKILVDDRFPIVPERTSIANAQGNFTTYVQGHWKENDDFWWVQTK
jgi:hypothetical protein